MTSAQNLQRALLGGRPDEIKNALDQQYVQETDAPVAVGQRGQTMGIRNNRPHWRRDRHENILDQPGVNPGPANNNRDALLGAIADADAHTGNSEVTIPGQFGFTGLIEVPNGVTLWGSGTTNQQFTSASCLVARDADAKIRVLGSGGIFGNFLLDGADIGQNLMEVTGGSNHVFMNLRVQRGVSSLLRLVGLQNANFYQTFLSYCGGPGLILDTSALQGSYNNAFFGGEFANCDGGSIVFQATGGGTVTYNDDNLFIRMICENFENLPHHAATTMIRNLRGRRNIFDTCQITNGVPEEPFSLYKTEDVGGVNSAVFRDCLFYSGATDYGSGIEVGPSSSVRLEGFNRFQSLLNAMSVDTAAFVCDVDRYDLISTTNFFSSPNGATEQSKIIHTTRSRKSWRVRNATDVAASITTEAAASSGIYLELRPDRIGFHSGTGFTPDTILDRASANVLRTPDRFQAVDGVTTKTKAGTPTDADFASTPADGTMVVDTTANKLWVRMGGTWRQTAALT